MSIQIPNYLEPYQTYRPNVAMKFVDKKDRDMIMVLVYKSKELENISINESNYYQMCQGEIDELNSHNMPSNLNSCELINIENLPAINMTLNTMGKRLDKDMTSYDNNLIFIYKDYLVCIMASYSSRERLENLIPIYYQVLNSIVYGSR